MNFKKFFQHYVCVLLLCFSVAASASSLDSLFSILKHANDTQIAIINLDIGKQYLKERNYPAALKYFNISAVESHKILYEVGEGVAFQNLAKVYSRKTDYDSSAYFYKKAQLIFDKINRPECKLEFLNDYAVLYYYKGEYNTAIKLLYRALIGSPNVVDKKIISRINNNLGNCYYFLKEFQKALYYYNKSYELALSMSNKNSMANCLGNIGLIYFELGQYEASLKNHLLSYNLQKEIADTNEMAASLINIGLIYEKKQQYAKALALAKESLMLRRLIKDDRRIAFSIIKVANLEAQLKNYSEAKRMFMEALEISKRNESQQYLLEVYEGLSDIEEKQGNYKTALEFHHLYAMMKDSIFNHNIAEEIAEAQEKYQSEKKQIELEVLQKDQIINQNKFEKNRSYLYITIFIIFTVLVLLVLLYKQFSLKKKSNLQLEKQNLLISLQKKEITDSINYASIIQRSILPTSIEFNQLFPHHLIKYLPKDIVSGDFYWCGQRGNIKALVVADCTGHGVPGAMMSMVGSNLLNQAFNDQQLSTPREILHFLDHGIIKNLHQYDNLLTSKNSMDLSICIIDEEKHQINYGGSINPIYFFRNSELTILKTDKIPIGYQHNEEKKAFNSYVQNYHRGDRIYMFSDGIQDQFGGPKGKKLMAKNFQQLLLQIQNQDMQVQELKFFEFINNWKGSYEQTDDMLLIGIEL